MSNVFKFFLSLVFATFLVSLFLFLNKQNLPLGDIQASPVQASQEIIQVVAEPEPFVPEIENDILTNPNDYFPAILEKSDYIPQQQVFSDPFLPKSQIVDSYQPDGTVLYTGAVAHIFFHSLIVYPEKAATDYGNTSGYDDYMITRDQFNIILQQLYEQDYILIDSRILYSIDTSGAVSKRKLYLPPDKKPLIISLDDLSYYNYMKNGGFANKLVLQNGKVRTEVITPEGNTVVTGDGDVVPILDDFVLQHPDFSWQGAKGIIALTGYEGILGYDTNLEGSLGDHARIQVQPIIQALKNTGWIFASHSYSHGSSFRKDTISEEGLAYDIAKWRKEVGSLVGDTEIFIGPFGQVFSSNKARRKQLVEAGFPILYGVGFDFYSEFVGTYFVMDRMDIDGYRIRNNPTKFKTLLGIDVSKL